MRNSFKIQHLNKLLILSKINILKYQHKALVLNSVICMAISGNSTL
jgi:hypothetical protein